MTTETLAAFKKIMENRRSVRGFQKTSVPQAVLEQVFTLAQRSPSNCNTQPWQVVVVSGERCDQLRKVFSEAMMKGDMSLDYPYDGIYEGDYKIRQHEAAKALYEALGIARDDKVGRNIAFMENYQFFGAPHVAFLLLPADFGIREAADLGMFAQNLMLSMTAHGLASCPQTALSFQANQLREELGLSKDLKLLFGISFGYEDDSHPANNCRVGRAELSDVVQFFE